MALNRYDVSDSSTWKNRFTKSGLKWDGLINSGKIIIPVVLLIFFNSMSSIIYIVQDETNIKIKLVIFLFALLAFPLGIKYAFVQANLFVQKFYGLPDDYTTRQLIKDKLFVPPPLPSFLEKKIDLPFIILTKVEDLDKEKYRHARWFGGPALLVIYDGVAVYVERGNEFSRVLGPGIPLSVLEHHERIKAIVDLRPMKKEDVVQAWTKDGVQVDAHVQAGVQILSSDEAKQRLVVLEEGQNVTRLVYPFDPDNIKRVVENVAVGISGEELSEKTWHDAAMGSITGGIKAHISRYSLNELITRSENSPQFLSFEVSSMLFDNISSNLANSGYRLLELQITKFVPVDEEIKEKLEEYWKAKREKKEIIRKGRAEAQDIRVRQNARTIAYQDFLSKRISQLQEISRDGRNTINVDVVSSTEATVMLLTQVFEKSGKDPLLGTFVAREMLKTLDALRDQLKS